MEMHSTFKLVGYKQLCSSGLMRRQPKVTQDLESMHRRMCHAKYGVCCLFWQPLGSTEVFQAGVFQGAHLAMAWKMNLWGEPQECAITCH